ncbi:ribosomal protein S18 acetylase RimI-like enzyme [Paenibacillus shirakamiensis]|uniref:Ribosomal protein S18 acetylase RimI-like enzyme n=1 Tax=Paenibacillus shirakamiensis TaxID=1265935 RepID=A0ABS4JGQ1_9BACL|nr:GNAT family N-acetyltransferase [Paenibacillus shirakamiensis]MBP2000899.1 ribosomal protein S18 acetylase RimI-like enzyme [Paenibacillus shirakamiensis]
MIRLSTQNEDPLHITQIAELIYIILRDMELEIVGQFPKEKVLDFLRHLFVQGGNRFSYHNIVLSELKNTVAGIAVVYKHDDAAAFDKQLELQMMNFFEIDTIHIEPETMVEEFYLDSLVVNESYRGQGIGGELLRAVEELAILEGYHQLSLNVETDNIPAQRLYYKMGFIDTQVIHLYEHDYNHLVKQV